MFQPADNSDVDDYEPCSPGSSPGGMMVLTSPANDLVPKSPVDTSEPLTAYEQEPEPEPEAEPEPGEHLIFSLPSSLS